MGSCDWSKHSLLNMCIKFPASFVFVIQIYMDWANHYLHKAGYSDVLMDLKDISDGNFLPKVIQSVGELIPAAWSVRLLSKCTHFGVSLSTLTFPSNSCPFTHIHLTHTLHTLYTHFTLKPIHSLLFPSSSLPTHPCVYKHVHTPYILTLIPVHIPR